MASHARRQAGRSGKWLAAAIAGALALALAAGGAQAAGMAVTSSSYQDGAAIGKMHAHNGAGSDGSQCGGGGVSPQVAWNKLPEGAKSVALLMFDPDGNGGLGVSHWVAYNIPAERGQVPQGEGQTDGRGITVGKNVRGEAAYRGPCPPAGQVPHHYILTVLASDLAPGALQPGLTRDELLAALKGHVLEAQSVVGRYGR